MYEYRAKYIDNYDGDTITFYVDFGFKAGQEITVRLKGVDTPELRGGTKESKKKAMWARDFVRDELTAAKDITIRTEKDKKGKYGRYIATVIYKDRNDYRSNLSIELVKAGLAVEKEY